jgi:hypothetical protein
MKIFQEIKNFLDKDPSLQTLEEAKRLQLKLFEKLVPEDPFKDMEIPPDLANKLSAVVDEFQPLLNSFYGRLNQLYGEFYNALPSADKILKPYLENPQQPSLVEWRNKERRDSIVKIRRFLRDERVKVILRSLPSPDDKGFVVSVLEPQVFSWIRRGKNELTYMEPFLETLTSSSVMLEVKTSKPGPKSMANECIVLLTMHLKHCFKCFEKCRHNHPPIYQSIADLFNACEMNYRNNWSKDQVKMRHERIRKGAGFSENWWDCYYKNKFYISKDIGRKTGLIGLIRRYLR